MIIFELLQLFNYSDNIQYALCISYSSEFSVNDFIIVWSFIQYVSSVICFLRQDVFARILLPEKFLSSRATLYWYLDKKKEYTGNLFYLLQAEATPQQLWQTGPLTDCLSSGLFLYGQILTLNFGIFWQFNLINYSTVVVV